ncbi:MAG: 50S ribosomal protein L10 [Patescibacteria group bacterium]|nr:50S ribosomal protein L10 [Patescibacteria group bacterium]
MAKVKSQKEKDLQELKEKLAQAKAVVFSDYRGTTVKDLDKFRKTLRKDNIFSKVYKLTLVKKALEENNIAAPALDYKTPVILSISAEDETAPARSVKNMSKDIKTIAVLEGIADGKVISKDQVLALADMPTKQELRGMVVRTINAPVSGFVNVLAGNIRGLVNVLNAMAQK